MRLFVTTLLILASGCSEWNLFGWGKDTQPPLDSGGGEACEPGVVTLDQGERVSLYQGSHYEPTEDNFGAVIVPGRRDGAPAIWVANVGYGHSEVYLLGQDDLSDPMPSSMQPLIVDGGQAEWFTASYGALTTAPGAEGEALWLFAGLDDDRDAWFLFDSPPARNTSIWEADTVIEKDGGLDNGTEMFFGDLDGDGLDDAGMRYTDSYSFFLAPLAPYYDWRDDVDHDIPVDEDLDHHLQFPCVVMDVSLDGHNDLVCQGTTHEDRDSHTMLGVYLGPLTQRDQLAAADISFTQDGQGGGGGAMFYGGLVTSLHDAGDLTGDGRADVVVSSTGGPAGEEELRTVFVFDDFREGVWSSEDTAAAILVSPDFEDGQNWEQVAQPAGDINGDGVNDLLVSPAARREGALTVWIVPGPLEGEIALEESETRFEHSFDPAPPLLLWYPIPDLDGDGTNEFVVSQWSYDQASFFHLFRGCEHW